MGINLNNYEAYFLDFVEGRLSLEQKEELNSFVSLHPELKEELQSFESILLEPTIEKLSDAKKSQLKKEERTQISEADYLMISEVEGQITKSEKQKLGQIIQSNESLMDDLAIYHRAKLQKDKVVFPNKASLRKKENKIIWWQYASVAAAVILAFLFIYEPANNGYSPRNLSFDNSFADFVISPAKRSTTAVLERVDEIPSNTSVKAIAVNNPISPNSASELNVIEQEVELASLNQMPKIQSFQIRGNELSSAPKLAEPLKAQNKELQKEEEDDYLTITDFVKNEIEEEVLQNKSLKEAIVDELAEMTNNQIKFERKVSEDKKSKGFAFNLGKFGISKY